MSQQAWRDVAPASTRGGLAGWQIRALKRLSADDIAALSVASMAKVAGLTQHHFSRAFRSTFGLSPRDWILEIKLGAARERLLTSQDTVDQIALSLGYRSGSQLARIFRAREGISPQQFRRR
jgi:AraC family transcriptional regulator